MAPANAVAPMAGTPPPGYEHLGYQNELDLLLATDNANGAYMGNQGLSLGFDSDHNWNDGTGPDLFDGYWFRPGWGSISGEGGLGSLTVNGGQGGLGMSPHAMCMGPMDVQQAQDSWDSVKMEQ